VFLRNGMNPRRVTVFLGAIGGLLAILSAFIPWYNVAGFSFNLLSAIRSNPCPARGYCEIIPVSPTMIVAFICTVFGGSLGISSTLLHRRSAKLARIFLSIGMVTIIVGAVVSLSDAIVREGLSLGFYTDSFSAVLFMIHIIAEVLKR
jgi:glucan phosphoethanolaminetransferase (alkaline phosphatase superfamily)